ncbi:MAG: hypothetical protein ACRDRA_13125 [Pseudonocardiaceae bacterium]
MLVVGACTLSVAPVATAVDRTRACAHPADILDLANFKAGAYTQANCKNSSPCKASNYGEVVIYRVTVSHQN